MLLNFVSNHDCKILISLELQLTWGHNFLNHSSYMSKTLRKAIMRRSYLEEKYLKKNEINLLEPTKGRKVIAVDFTGKKEKSFSMG